MTKDGFRCCNRLPGSASATLEDLEEDKEHTEGKGVLAEPPTPPNSGFVLRLKDHACTDVQFKPKIYSDPSRPVKLSCQQLLAWWPILSSPRVESLLNYWGGSLDDTSPLFGKLEAIGRSDRGRWPKYDDVLINDASHKVKGVCMRRDYAIQMRAKAVRWTL